MLVLRAVGNSGKPEGAQVVIQGILEENILFVQKPKYGGAIARPPGSYEIMSQLHVDFNSTFIRELRISFFSKFWVWKKICDDPSAFTGA